MVLFFCFKIVTFQFKWRFRLQTVCFRWKIVRFWFEMVRFQLEMVRFRLEMVRFWSKSYLFGSTLYVFSSELYVFGSKWYVFDRKVSLSHVKIHSFSIFSVVTFFVSSLSWQNCHHLVTEMSPKCHLGHLRR